MQMKVSALTSIHVAPLSHGELKQASHGPTVNIFTNITLAMVALDPNMLANVKLDAS